MMKTSKIFTIIYTFLILTTSYLYSQKKDVIWIHGLNGEAGSANFRNHASIFNRNFNNIGTSFAPYSSISTKYNGVSRIADQMHLEVSMHPYIRNNKAIYVGHSLGGMVTKELDIRYHRGERNGKNISGIITLGSPLSGAKIANSLESSYYNNWIFGWGSPINRMISETAYNAGRSILGSFGGIHSYIYFKTVSFRVEILSFISTNQKKGFLSDILPMYGQTWRDLKIGGQGHAYRRNISTSTPKINIWGEVKKPVLETLARNYNQIGNYYGMVNFSRAMANGYGAVPGLGYFAREAMKSHAYFKYTIHGKYTNLIADGVRYRTERMQVRTVGIKRYCYTQVFQRATRSCRSWGWFSWLCSIYTTIWEVIKCHSYYFWGMDTIYYSMPTYPDTDGLVSKSSATAQGQRWQGVAIKSPDTDHGELAGRGSNAEVILKKIFNGEHEVVIRKGENFVNIFKMK